MDSQPNNSPLSAPAHREIDAAIEHHCAGRLEEAKRLYAKITAENPNDADAFHLLGVADVQSGDSATAEPMIRRAISLNPNIPEYHNSLANVLKTKGDIESALDSYRRALGLRSDYPAALQNLTATLKQKGAEDPAIVPLRAEVVARPTSPAAHYQLGCALASHGYCDESIESFREVIRLDPASAQGHNNLAFALTEKGLFDQAIEQYRRGIAIKPDWPDLHVGLAILLLTLGRFREAWNDYEWRWKVNGAPLPTHNFTQPRWQGEPLNGRTILLFAEQGFGDMIQFLRYAPQVAARGGRVLVVCLPQLVRLFQNFPGVEQVLPPGKLPPFHVQCPLLSLPMVFDTQVETIPSSPKYLTAPTDLLAKWKDRLDPSDRRLKVGITWTGRPTHPTDRLRSIPLEKFAPLAGHKHVTFHNLQRPEPYLPPIEPPGGMQWIDLASHFDDFAETAALISHLDLVITVDTAIAHLAGALGKPVWVLLPYIPDWRWMLQRTDSPWYPSMRLFRQTYPGDWDGVIGRVSQFLSKLR